MFFPTPKEHGRRLAWVTGAGGLIGNYLANTPRGDDWQVRALTRPQLDLSDSVSVERAFRSDSPDLVLHCAAVSKVIACAADPPLAWRINVEVTRHLAELAESIPFVFISTDLVFDGRLGNYDESASPNPLSDYGETKAAAEAIVLNNPRHTVIRTSLNCGTSPTGNRAFNEEMALAWKAGRTLRLFTDEFRSPIPAEITARAIWEFARNGQVGLFHVAGADRLSRWDAGRIIAHLNPELNPRLIADTVRNFTGPPRPRDTSLDCRKAAKALSFRLPGLREALEGNRPFHEPVQPVP